MRVLKIQSDSTGGSLLIYDETRQVEAHVADAGLIRTIRRHTGLRKRLGKVYCLGEFGPDNSLRLGDVQPDHPG